jgi:hypothetical protein
MISKRAKGFTLVELLLGMSLTILVGGVLYLLQSTGMRSVSKGTTQLILTSEVRRKMERMVADLRNTKELINISPSSLKIRCYQYSKEKPEAGEAALITVAYELEKSGKNHVLWRTVNRENPKKILNFKKIDDKIFFPFFKGRNKNSPTGWSYMPFDMVANDSGQRKRITFIQIRLKLSQRNDSASLITSVQLRPAASRLKQPNWKFR